MLPDRVSNTGPLTYETGALPIALRGPAMLNQRKKVLGRSLQVKSIRLRDTRIPRITEAANIT